jgi:GDP-mannose 6-dehydrogenase
LKTVAVFGIGYVGGVTAACLARDGLRVTGVDVDAEKVAELAAGRAPVAEPGLDALVAEQVAVGRLSATTDAALAVRESEAALIAVGTPSDGDGAVSSRAVEAVVSAIGEALRGETRPYRVVVRSTLLPGILEETLAPLLERASGRRLGQGGLTLANNPEFLREGSALEDFDRPPLVLVGASDRETAAAVLGLYARAEARRVVTDTRTAALVKYASNAFHALKVAFANEVGALARTLGVDGRTVMEIACQDTRLNVSPAYLRPGFAFGGSCLPKDLRALVNCAERHSLDLDLLATILPSNEAHLLRALRRVEEAGRQRAGLVGLSFKAGTDDLRESPLVVLAEALLKQGIDLRIYDPWVNLGRLRGRNRAYVDRHLPHLAALLVEDADALLAHAEVLVLGGDAAAGRDWRLGFAGELIDLRRDLVAPAPGPI